VKSACALADGGNVSKAAPRHKAILTACQIRILNLRLASRDCGDWDFNMSQFKYLRFTRQPKGCPSAPADVSAKSLKMRSTGHTTSAKQSAASTFYRRHFTETTPSVANLAAESFILPSCGSESPV
jgi:hypothetical protein